MPGAADAKLLHNAGAATRALDYFRSVCYTAHGALEELHKHGVPWKEVEPILLKICGLHDELMPRAQALDAEVLALIKAHPEAVPAK